MRYLDLFQTLEKLKDIPQSYQPQRVAQLSDACMNKKITPVFQYNGYSLTNICGIGESAEYINIPITGYLTHENISDVFNWSSKREKKKKFTDAIIYELTQEEENAPKEKFALAKTTFHHLRPIGNAKSFHFDVQAQWHTRLYSLSDEKDAERMRDLGGVEISQNDLLFPTEQVEDYISSFISDNEESYLNLLTLDDSAINDKIEQREREVQVLKEQNAQLTANYDNLQVRIADLESQLNLIDQSQASPLEDYYRDVPHQAYKTIDRVMYAMTKLTQFDNSNPYSQNKPSLNSKIATILQNEGLSLEYQAIGKWLSRVNDVQSPLSNPISTIKS